MQGGTRPLVEEATVACYDREEQSRQFTQVKAGRKARRAARTHDEDHLTMSEYQYYEFLAVDHPLDERQRTELRALSTRARITATSFVNEYHWGDFRGNPAVLMERYFDAFLYLANWGTRRLMIRLPRELLDLGVAKRYCTGDAASVWAVGDHVILSLSSEDEDEYWEEGEGRLASIALVRSELAAGDLRLLYLAWLLSVQAAEAGDEEAEPPVPPGLRTLSAPLHAVADFLRIDEDLLAAAAARSAEVQTVPQSAGELTTWIEGLPDAEKNSLLLRAARGEGSQVQAVLQRRFLTEGSLGGAPADPGTRTAGELRDAAATSGEERERLAAERRAQEQARQARAVAAAREQRLDALALREEQAWQQVNSLIDSRKPREYDEAVAILVDLRGLAERSGDGNVFSKRIGQLREEHLRKPSLLQRFDKAGL